MHARRALGVAEGVCLLSVLLCCGTAEARDKHDEGVYPRPMLLLDSVVTRQWPAALSPVNAPVSLKYLSPGQCVRIGVVSGPDQQRSLDNVQIGFRVRLSGNEQVLAPEPPKAVRQIKPEGYDLVVGALHAAGVGAPKLGMASMAASSGQWCVPGDAAPGTVEFDVSAFADGKTTILKPAFADIDSFTAPDVPFKTADDVGQFIMAYHFSPRPALLVPAVRLLSADQQAASNTQQFLVSAFREDPQSAALLGPEIAASPKPTQLLMLYLLAKANVTLVNPPTLDEAEKNTVAQAPPLPDPYDVTPNPELWSRLDLLWAEFFATGHIEPVRAITRALAWRKDYEAFVQMRNEGKPVTEFTDSIVRGLTFSAAGWGLGSFQRTDRLAADYIEAIAASPETPPEIKKELAVLQTDPAFRESSHK